jgi:hypothetical protein
MKNRMTPDPSPGGRGDSFCQVLLSRLLRKGFVTPAKAGVQELTSSSTSWIPAFAGMAKPGRKDLEQIAEIHAE